MEIIYLVFKKMLVIILQSETKQCDNNIANLKHLFSDPFFIVQVCKVDEDINIDNHHMRKALNFAAEGPYQNYQPTYAWAKLPVLIVKDSSVSYLDRNLIKERILTALDKASHADLYYLCKWNDACHKFVDVDNSEDLKYSLQPTSTQAIIYSSSSRDKVREALLETKLNLSEYLNLQISQSKLSAVIFSPNIIQYDINLARTKDDFLKLNECQQMVKVTNETSSTQIVWLIVFIILVVIVLWVCFQVYGHEKLLI